MATRVECGLKYAVLGPLEAKRAGQPCELGPHRQQLVLALLLCRANSVVPVSSLVDALWRDDPPRTVRKNLQVHLSTLRGLLGLAADQLTFQGHGYLLRATPAELDLLRFGELAEAGRRALRTGDTAGGVRLLDEAVRLRRGPVLAALAGSGPVAAEAVRIESLYLSACEDWAEASLELASTAAIAGVAEKLDELVRREPFRERLRRAQLLALYRSGRRAEALASYDAVRQEMSRELGLEPSPVLRAVYEAILADDPALRPAVRPRALRPPVPVTRLPRDVPVLHGRDAERLRLLGGPPGCPAGGLAVITGPPGAGKTALAVHVAHRLAADFPDGRLFTRLRLPDGRRRAAREVLREALRGAGFDGTLPGRADECVALLQTMLAGRRFLLVLDDVPDETAVRPLLPSAGPSGVLITSQRRLTGLDATSWTMLGALEPDAAVEMLAGAIGLRRVLASLAAAQRIVALCGLLPLPIRMAGARLLGLPHLPLDALASRLADERRLLDELTAGDTGLRPCLTAWYHGLTGAERRAVGVVGALPSFFPADVGGRLGSSAADVEQALDALVMVHAIEPALEGEVSAHSEPRYLVPPFVRALVSSLPSGDRGHDVAERPEQPPGGGPAAAVELL